MVIEHYYLSQFVADKWAPKNLLPTTISWPFNQGNPGEPVLSQRRNLLEQLLDFYEPGSHPATHP